MAYTSHGYHIPLTELDEEPPILTSICGGIYTCDQCTKEARETPKKGGEAVPKHGGEVVPIFGEGSEATEPVGWAEIIGEKIVGDMVITDPVVAQQMMASWMKTWGEN